LVLNKSSGLNVHPGDHKSDEVSLIEQVHDYYAGMHDSLTFKPSLIHRIDRNTSGIIMIAKSKAALTGLSDDFKKHDALKKTYFCIVL
jgi:23S rRNA-/tRNA-specific pseudouridylate synthase